MSSAPAEVPSPGAAGAKERAQHRVEIRPPTPEDGTRVHALIASCPPLERNSLYCNLLQCTHFADTCAIAADRKCTLGFVSAYLLPEQLDTLFVWQVAVNPAARGAGIGKRLMLDILTRPVCERVDYLHATVTESNDASTRMFRSLAAALSAPLRTRVAFDAEEHLDGMHESERLLVIGPFDRFTHQGTSQREVR